MDFEQVYNAAAMLGGRLVGAIAVLVIGLQITKYFVRYLRKSFAKHRVDQSLRDFLISLVQVGSYVLLGIIVVSTLGVEMTSVLALLTSAGVAIGLALQGSLSNFAGGVLILVLKMFKVGDYIEGAGHAGTVQAIQLFYTVLITPDNRKVIVPNAELANSSIVDYSANPIRRLDLVFSTSYDDDIELVKGILGKVVREQSLILSDPAPQILVGEMTSNSVNYYLRVWTKTEDFWPLKWTLLEQVRREFCRAGIKVPSQHIDIRVKSEEDSN